MVEIEVKIRIDNIESLKDKIEAQGARCVKERYHEENILYDFPGQTLYTKQHALRLRTVSKKTFMTFKGATQKSRKFKIRKEYETEVKNRQQMKKILRSLGLSPAFQYQKFRTVYRKKNLEICLDETPVGNFLELEGQQNEIVKFAQSLGFSKKEFIKTDYVQLLKNAGNKQEEISED